MKKKKNSENYIKIVDIDTLKNTFVGAASHPVSFSYREINKMIGDEKLVRVGKGRYVYESKKTFNYDLKDPLSIKAMRFFKKNKLEDLEYIIYESTILNEFLNHQIVNPVLIIEVNKEYAEDVFWKLKESGFKDILFCPTEDEKYRYDPSIIVKKMVSKSPINKANHKISIEKLIVDIVSDKILNQFYEGAERHMVLEEITDKYAVNYGSVKNYANRRNALEALLTYLPESKRGYFNG